MFKNINSTLLLASFSITTIADWVLKLAIPLIIYSKTKSSLFMSIAYGIEFLPYVIMMPIGGVISDLLKKKNILIVGDIAALVLTIILFIHIIYFQFNIYFIFFIIFLIGFVSAIYHPAFQGSIPLIVSKNQLAHFNGHMHVIQNSLTLVAPALAGFLFIVMDESEILIITIIGFFISLIFILKMNIRAEEHVKKFKEIFNISLIINELKSGIKEMHKNPIISWATYLFVFQVFGGQIIVGNIVFILIEHLQLSKPDIAYILALSSIGSIVAAFVVPKFLDKFHPGRFIVVSSFIVLTGFIILMFSNSFFSFLIGRIISSIGETSIIICMFTYRQKAIPQTHLSRVISIARTISWIPMPIAPIIGGYLLNNFNDGYSIILYISVSSYLLCCIIMLFTPLTKKSITKIS